MKRNRFRLATVMRVRQIQEDIEMGRLTQARLDVANAQLRQAERAEAYKQATQPDGKPVPSHQFLRERSKFERLGDQVVDAAHEVSLARNEEQLRRQDWSIAAQRVSALDRLRDRHNESYQSELATEEVQDTDERTNQRRFHSTRSIGPTVPAHPAGPLTKALAPKPAGPTRTTNNQVA